jgi:hypothetical protein
MSVPTAINKAYSVNISLQVYGELLTPSLRLSAGLPVDRASVRVPTDYERQQNCTDSVERRGAVSRGNWHTLYAS